MQADRDTPEIPLACSLDVGRLYEQRAWIENLNRSALLETLRQGRHLILTYRRDHIGQVRELVRRERDCCAFLEFDLADNGQVATLDIEAPESAAGILDFVFAPFLPGSPEPAACGCAAGHLGRQDNVCG